MLADKKMTAIITGGGSGIGLAIAKKFVQNNIFTIITGRDKQKLETAKKLLGDLCDTWQCDLNNLAEIPKMVEALVKKYDHIDILVNNAMHTSRHYVIKDINRSFYFCLIFLMLWCNSNPNILCPIRLADN